MPVQSVEGVAHEALSMAKVNTAEIKGVSERIESHEDVCGQRYVQLDASILRLEGKIEASILRVHDRLDRTAMAQATLQATAGLALLSVIVNIALHFMPVLHF
jgi:hypothetical protein